MRFCLFGLGEAGSAIAADLAITGVAVSGYDPAAVTTPPGVVRHDTPQGAAANAQLVLAVTAGADARTALDQAFDTLPPSLHYADLSTGSPALKRELAARTAEAGIAFTDVALMATVPGKGVHTPALASGLQADQFAEIMAPLGMPIEIVGPEAGTAAMHKLLRSVTIKGLAAVLIESIEAANRAGISNAVWHNLVDQLTAADEGFVRRIISGTGKHAERRTAEMEAAVELLEDLAVEPTMTRATVESLRRVTDTGRTPQLPPSNAGDA